MATLRHGKNKASHYVCDGYNFDSQEEIEFYLFLKDALRLGLIKEFEYQPKAFILIPKCVDRQKVKYKKKEGYKIEEHTLYQEHAYTADFKFTINPKLFKLLGDKHRLRINKGGVVYIDVKGAYNRFGGDRIFPINQKLLYATHGIHVNKLVPIQFFQKIGAAPDELRWMKGRKVKTLKKHYVGLLSLEELCKAHKGYKKSNISETETNIPFLAKLAKH